MYSPSISKSCLRLIYQMECSEIDSCLARASWQFTTLNRRQVSWYSLHFWACTKEWYSGTLCYWEIF